MNTQVKHGYSAWLIFMLSFFIPPAFSEPKIGISSPLKSRSTEQNSRHTIIISDLHFGLGCSKNATCVPTEDFRWSKALKGFLDEVSHRGNNKTDLVIGGDFLELWQPPASIPCIGPNSDLGCTVPEAEQLVSLIVAAHKVDFATLSTFAHRGNNRLYIIPGNHDAALLNGSVWSLVAKALGAEKGRVDFVNSGVWNSNDKSILVEHGHQIGNDVNRYENWPEVTKSDASGKTFLIRTWGERFVQKLFNKEESLYPIIDNLSPESAGAWYRQTDIGLAGSAKDIARFVAFHLFETSFSQKAAEVGAGRKSAESREGTVEAGRELGYEIFTKSLDQKDPLKALIESKNPAALNVQRELAALAQDLPDADIRLLCEKAPDFGASTKCDMPKAGAIIQSVIPKSYVMQKHLEKRMKDFPDTKIFVYGHTHQIEREWSVTVFDNKLVRILNTGAFQRLIGSDQYTVLVDKLKVSPGEALRAVRLEQLAPCYSAVEILPGDRDRVANSIIWHMNENVNTGQVIDNANQCQPSL